MQSAFVTLLQEIQQRQFRCDNIVKVYHILPARFGLFTIVALIVCMCTVEFNTDLTVIISVIKLLDKLRRNCNLRFSLQKKARTLTKLAIIVLIYAYA